MRRDFSRWHLGALRQEKTPAEEQEEQPVRDLQDEANENAFAATAAADAEFLEQLADERIENEETVPQEELVQLLLKSKQLIAEKEAAIRDWQVKALDALAEMENIRRTSKRDIEQIQSSQKTAFFKEFITVVDKLEDATRILPESMIERQEELIQEDPDYKHPILLLQGLQMTMTELFKALAKHKVKATPERLGVEFDPRLHVVAGTVESAVGPDGAPLPANSIVSVLRKGYLLGDQVLRQAMVTIVKPPPPPPQPEEPAQQREEPEPQQEEQRPPEEEQEQKEQEQK